MRLLEWFNDLVWGIPALVMILGVGLYLSIRTGLIQLRLLPQAMRQFLRRLLGKDNTQEGSGFQALCTALAATVGTGNLAGVAGAIAIGGPGAIFWMWICAFFGMVTKYSEALLAVRYQTADHRGGPMYTMVRGLGEAWRPLAVCYCVFGVIAAFGVGNCTQINAMITGLHGVFEVFHWTPDFDFDLIFGIGLACLLTYMLLGGAGRIGRIAETLVPLAAGLYIMLSLGVLAFRVDLIPTAFCSIVQGAFDPRSITGGVIGSVFQTLRIGVSRGVFTNEAGMGTAAIAHGGATVKHPAEQGMMGIMEVFLDTIVICTLTGLVILVSGVSVPFGTDEGLALTVRSFSLIYGDWVKILIAAETCCFAFATVLGWGLYGARCAEFLWGADAWKHFAMLQGIMVIFGAVGDTATLWLLSDTVNGLMAIPNLIVLWLLTPEICRLTNEFYPGSSSAKGGTYEHFHQRKSLRTFSYEKVPSSGHESKRGR